MTNPILIKRSGVLGKVPATTDLLLGELAANTVDGKLFLKKSNGSEAIVEVGAQTITGDATGSGNGAITLTLANSGVIAGIYTKVLVDLKGRVTSGGQLASSDVTTALGFTPPANTNASVVSALGFTPANKAGDTFTGTVYAPKIIINSAADDNVNQLQVTGNSLNKLAADVKLTHLLSVAGNAQIRATNNAINAGVPLELSGSDIRFQNFGAEVARFSSNGDLGLGIATPTNAANYRTLEISGVTGAQVLWDAGSVSKGFIFNDTSNFMVGSAGALVFMSGGATERARMSSTGAILIAKTADDGVNKLQVNGSIASGQLNMTDTGANGVSIKMVGNGATTPSKTIRTQSGNFLVLNDAASTILTLTDAGAMTVTGDVTAFSDARVKTDVKTILNPLGLVEQMRGVTFIRTDLNDYARRTGVIAQEMQVVMPEVVYMGEDGKLSVAYGNLVGVLIESVKALKAEIDELKEKLK